MQLDPSAMTPAELRELRRSLGLSIKELAAVLGLDARADAAEPTEPALARSIRKPRPLYYRTVSKWEWEIKPISKANAEALARLIAYTDRAVAAIIEAYVPGRPIFTYVDDDALHRFEPEVWPSLPASWHGAVAWRAKQQIPGATIDYRSEN